MNNLTLIIPAKNENESLPIVLDSLENLKIKTIISLKEDDIDTINSIKNKKNIKLFFSIWIRIWKFIKRSNRIL